MDDIFGTSASPSTTNTSASTYTFERFPVIDSSPAFKDPSISQIKTFVQDPNNITYTATSLPTNDDRREKRFPYNLTKDDFYNQPSEPSSSAAVPIFEQHAEDKVWLQQSSTSEYPQIRDLPYGSPVSKVPLIIMLAILTLAGLTVFITTCVQFSSHTETAKGSKLYVVSDPDTDPCSIILDRPLRFSFQGDDEYLYCTWTTKSNVARFFLSLFSTVWPVLGFWSILKKKRTVSWAFTVISCIAAVGWFLMMCSDANDVRISSSWCNEGLQGLQLSPAGVTVNCNYTPYAGTCLGEAGNFIVWGITTFVVFRYLRKSV